MNRTRFTACYLLSLLVLNMAACSSMQTVSIENAMRNRPPSGIDFGSLVEVNTLDKKTVKFRVTEIGDTGLGGKPGFYHYEDMQSLRIEKAPQSNDKVLAYVLGTLGIIALVALIANADSVAVCAPSPCPIPE